MRKHTGKHRRKSAHRKEETFTAKAHTTEKYTEKTHE